MTFSTAQTVYVIAACVFLAVLYGWLWLTGKGRDE